MLRLIPLLALTTLLGGCGLWSNDGNNDRPPPDHPVDDVLGVSLPLGWAANLAVTAVQGNAPTCVELAEGCRGAHCLTNLRIHIDETCPLPLLDGAEGSIEVTGLRLLEGSALLRFDFRDVRIGSQQLMADQMRSYVFYEEDGVQAVWAWSWIGLSNEEISVNGNGWVVDVEREDGLADPAAAEIVVNGFENFAAIRSRDAGETELYDVDIIDAVFVPECGRNPVDGSATWGEIGTRSLALDLLDFHPTCDGQADAIGLHWGDLALELVR